MNKTNQKQEYIYNFIGGGWNSEFAYSTQEAIAQAKARWGDSKILIVDEKSFRVPSDCEMKLAMSNFD
jgi:hypothetical protein